MTKQEQEAIKMYDSSSAEIKTALEQIFGAEIFQKDITIRSYEDALKKLGIKHFNESGLTPDEIAYNKLKIITAALNCGWKADWSDSNQAKYVPWFDTSSGFVFDDAGYYCSAANAGYASRLCFKDRETAEYAGKQFIDLYKIFIL